MIGSDEGFADWESIYVNLGHVYRKQQRWPEAEEVYFKALSLKPGQASTYGALAFTYHLQVPTSLSQHLPSRVEPLGFAPQQVFLRQVESSCEYLTAYLLNGDVRSAVSCDSFLTLVVPQRA